MESFVHLLKRRSGWLKVLPLALSLCLSARPVAAASSLFYNNDAIDTTTTPVNTLDSIDATNFVNDSGGTFTWDYFSGGGWPSTLYHGWHNTRNFTNNGTMESATGFWFDTQKSGGLLDYEAASFYNAGPINCGVSGSYLGLGGLSVWATNLVNAGTFRLGLGARGAISGHNLDFTRGSILMDNPNSQIDSFNGFSGQTGAFGLNTNGWNPGALLQPTMAMASPPYPLLLTNATVYLDFTTNLVTSNILVRAIFVKNLNATTVTENHYFDLATPLGLGSATVEWISAYQSPYDGTYTTNYLYLNNDFVQGAATNNFLNNNIPSNFYFSASGTSQAGGLNLATNTGFPPGFSYPYGSISNRYAYADVKLISTSVDTNTAFLGVLTNLLGRVEVTASNELNLSLSTIAGMNYLRLNSPNQYDNDGNSRIQAPYSDSYLGSTNGNLVITNLLGAFLPAWSGRIQAWSTLFTNAAGADGFTHDYRVLLVQSAITPFSMSQQQDFVLYASNNVVISDSLNVFRTLSINATNLLITTNGAGNGAYSFQGELNLNSSALHWDTSLPRLRNLTNNGAIRTINQALYGSGPLPYFAFVNTGVVTNGNGAAIVANDFETSDFFSAGNGSFSVQSQTSTMTNGIMSAAGTFSSTSSNLVIAGTTLTVGKSITIYATNLLNDTGVTNGNMWTLGSAFTNSGGASSSAPGLVLPLKPVSGDLLGTTIHSLAPGGTLITHTWSGADYGYSVAGFSNNAAIGQLLLDAQGPPPHTQFLFVGTGAAGVTNAIYVDNLQLLNQATNGTATNSYYLTSLAFSNNLVIYYAQAMLNGVSIAEKLNHNNGNHLRWVPTYAGYFSSTNVVYPAGVTNTVNAALALSPDIDSNGNGSPNNSDPTPLLVPAQVNFTESITNLPPKSVRLQWATIPNGTNYIYYTTNLLAPVWQPLTNFNNYYYGPNLAVPNPAHVNWFASPQAYPGPVTNVWIYDPFTNAPHFYRVMVQPWLTYPF